MSLRPGRQTLALVGALLLIGGIIYAIESLAPRGLRPTVGGALASAGAPSPGLEGQPGPPLPEVVDIEAWLNSPPLTVQDLRGKVVLVDFWTYSCVNCLRTLPYLKEWHNKYASRGLAILGIHTPEFAFEKDVGNVRQAVQRYGVAWPVALDNNYATWQAYLNRYWPHKYLADAEGRLRFHHIGEGAYRETEEWIRTLLVEAGVDLSGVPLGSEDLPLPERQDISRELYAGKAWRQGGYLGNAAVATEGATGVYQDPGDHRDGQIYYSGRWEESQESMRAAGPGPDGSAHIAISYRAGSANAVLRPATGQRATIEVQLDGLPVPRALAGDDLTYDAAGRSLLNLTEARMYSLVRSLENTAHRLKLLALSGEFSLFTFTFSAAS